MPGSHGMSAPSLAATSARQYPSSRHRGADHATESGLPSPADGGLLKADAYIDGAWRGANSAARFTVSNPADGLKLAEVANCGRAEADAAIEAAARAWPDWRRKTAKERAAVMRAWFQLIVAHQEDLAKLMTAEQGKPMAESRGEVAYGASFVEWFAEEAKRIYGDTIPTVANDRRLFVFKEPIGVAAAITRGTSER